MEQERPTGITLLAILFFLAGAAHVVGALQEFGMIPVVGGVGTGAGFFVSAPAEGIIQIAAAIISLFLGGGLWGMHRWSRSVVIAIAALNILVIFFTRFGGGENWLNALPGILINAAVLLYAQTATVRQALQR